MYQYIDKDIINKELDKIYFGIKLKDHNQIMSEIINLKNLTKEYRQPYQCSTCKDYPCSAYRVGCRDCSGWK